MPVEFLKLCYILCWKIWFFSCLKLHIAILSVLSQRTNMWIKMLKKKDIQKLSVEDTIRKKLSKNIHERMEQGGANTGMRRLNFELVGWMKKNSSSSVRIHILQTTKDPRTTSEEVNTFSLSSWDWTVISSYSWVFSHKMGLGSFAVLALRLYNLDQIIPPAFPILQLTKGTGRDFWASITTWQSLCVNK